MRTKHLTESQSRMLKKRAANSLVRKPSSMPELEMRGLGPSFKKWQRPMTVDNTVRVNVILKRSGFSIRGLGRFP